METKHEFFFYNLNDLAKEKIAKTKAFSLEEAEMTFSIVKGLQIDEFRKIYKVEKYNPDTFRWI